MWLYILMESCTSKLLILKKHLTMWRTFIQPSPIWHRPPWDLKSVSSHLIRLSKKEILWIKTLSDLLVKKLKIGVSQHLDMKLRILNHLAIFKSLWFFKLKPKEGKEPVFSHLREINLPTLTLQRQRKRQLFWKQKVQQNLWLFRQKLHLKHLTQLTQLWNSKVVLMQHSSYLVKDIYKHTDNLQIRKLHLWFLQNL